MLYLKNPHHSIKHIIVLPIISTFIVPLIILDIWIEIYHRICFPLCGMQYVSRKAYIQIFDRAKLPYLTVMQKLYCMYCGYANGALRYWGKIASETEQYRCGIQHKKTADFCPPEHQKDFAPYGDTNEFEKKYTE